MFGKKNKNDTEPQDKKKPAKKKFFTKTKLVVFLLLIGCISASGFVVYKYYFAKEEDSAPKFRPVTLEHVKLPVEILEFSFYQQEHESSRSKWSFSGW